MKNWKRGLLFLIRVLALLYLAACGYIRVNQIKVTFKPQSIIYTNHLRMGMEYEPVCIPVGSGPEKGELHGFWVPSTIPDAPAMLYLHGNDATIGKNLEHTERLHQLGYNVLLIDYRGFGKSFGTTQPGESKVYEDAEAAWEFLLEEKSFKPSQIFIYGHSLGGAVAIELAIRRPQAAGLITESTFTSILDMSAEQYNGWLRLLPMDLLLTQRFDSIDKIGELKIPVLLIHGKADKKIPFSMTKELHAAAPEPKELLLIEGGRHANSGSVAWVEYREKMAEFAGQHFKAAEPHGEQELPRPEIECFTLTPSSGKNW